MYNAVSGLGTQEGTLIEILVSGNNQLIRDTAVAYKNSKCKNFYGYSQHDKCPHIWTQPGCWLEYGHSMEKDIKGDTSGTLKMLLVSLAQVSCLVI